MYDVFAPSSTLSTRRIIDYLCFKKSHHTFIADVTNAFFHVDEDEECSVEPMAEWWEEVTLGNSILALWRLRK